MIELEPGDLLGFSGRDFVSDLINIFTYGIPRYSISHVAIVGEWSNKLVLYESTTKQNEPCLITGKRIYGVQANDLEKRITNFNGLIWVYKPVKNLTVLQRETLKEYFHETIGKHYDFFGAAKSAGYLISILHALKYEESFSTVFCSEFCAGAYRRIHLFDTLNASYWSPNKLLRRFVLTKVVKSPVKLK